MDKIQFESLMDKLKDKARFEVCTDEKDCYAFKCNDGSIDYFAFEDGIIEFNDSVKCNNLKIVDDALCDYIEVDLYVGDFEIGGELLCRKLDDKTWYLEELSFSDIVRELSKRCNCVLKKYNDYCTCSAFMCDDKHAVVFSINGQSGYIAEINAVDESGELKSIATIYGDNVIVEKSLYGAEYIDVVLTSHNKRHEIVRFRLKYNKEMI